MRMTICDLVLAGEFYENFLESADASAERTERPALLSRQVSKL